MRAGSIQVRFLGVLAVGISCSIIACSGGGGGPAPAPPSAMALHVDFHGLDFTATQGQPLDPPLTPAVTGDVAQFSVTPPLPAGLKLDPVTGRISGTPLVAMAATDYTIRASGATESTTTVIRLTVLSGPPAGLAYPGATFTATAGQALVPAAPAVTGTVTAYAVAPPLPPGIILDPATGVLSGTPTAASPATVYTITAANAAGSTSTKITLSVREGAPFGLAYAQPVVAGAVGQAIPPDLPAFSGSVTSFSIAPGLPAGLVLDPATGVLSGMPAMACAPVQYTVTASNAAGFTTARITLSVQASLQAPTGLSYPKTAVSALVGQALTVLNPSVTGPVSSYAVTPALPAGLGLHPTTGALAGTPSATASAATYTITASNPAGSTSTSLTLSVGLAAPSGLAYPQTVLAATVGQALPALEPRVQGTVTSYGVAPALPPGLLLSVSTGTLSGTPTAASAARTYTITAANPAGSASTALTLAVNAAPPGLRLIQCSGIVPCSDVVLASRAAIEMSPFDGIVFALKAGRIVFQTTPYTQASLAADRINVPQVNSARLTDNFLLMRGGVDTGFDRFSDAHWDIALANVRTFAEMAKLGNLKGIAFDPEYYANLGQVGLFDYGSYDATAHTFAQCQANLRRRGQQFMTALQEGYPDSCVFLFGALSMLRDGTIQNWAPSTFPSKPYGLMPDFLNGMLDVIAPGMTLVDANEATYTFYNKAWYANVKNLVLATDLQALVDPANQAKYAAQVQVAMSDYLDGSFDQSNNVAFLAHWLAESDRAAFFEYQVYYGLQATSRYHWVYSEHTDWFARTGIPPGAEAALASAKAKVLAGQPLGTPIETQVRAAAAAAGMGW